ncbi:Low temperature requirement protein LtrA [Amycolatopsis arida]|uniref:Low temperature requirement protein LtrA n=1 Tax=Amycolatopsis arida TaxID=587909 RepID=A0A1I5LFI3_9PSEU|nr:low temperature requirement protein A [Amycolatopsis arida]TDX93707.1 low temperature requirement protein LtrA [Amycolatopsis arida]SFO96119.1 Low temperature requirement protein LtrA [Amycolatopsis arida]
MPPRLTAVTQGHRVTTLELFFDLVFVYAITQTVQLMSDRLDLLGLGQGVMVVAVLWWSWCSYAWLGTTVRADEGLARFAMLGAMAVMFLVALAIPEAFGDFPGGLHAPLLFASCYLLVRVLHLAAYLGAAREDAALRSVVLRSTAPGLCGALILAGAAFTTGGVQLALWVVALLIDYVGVRAAGARGWQVPAPAHFAERFGLIVIVALGESIVAIGVGIGTLPISWPVVLTAVCGLVLAASMWWVYFDVVAKLAERRLAAATGLERVRLATDSYTYLHLPLITGIVLVALGMKKALLYVADRDHHGPAEALHGLPLWALAGGLALYLVTLSALRRRNQGTWNVQRLVVAGLLLAGAPLLELVPAAVLVVVVTGVMVGLISFERVRFGERRRTMLTAGQ